MHINKYVATVYMQNSLSIPYKAAILLHTQRSDLTQNQLNVLIPIAISTELVTVTKSSINTTRVVNIITRGRDKNVPGITDIMQGQAKILKELLVAYNERDVHTTVGKYLLDLHTYGKQHVKNAIYRYDIMKRILNTIKGKTNYNIAINAVLRSFPAATKQLLVNYARLIANDNVTPYSDEVSRRISGDVSHNKVLELGSKIAIELRGNKNTLQKNTIISSKNKFARNVLARSSDINAEVLIRHEMYNQLLKGTIKLPDPVGLLSNKTNILNILGVYNLNNSIFTDTDVADRIVEEISSTYDTMNKSKIKDANKKNKIEKFIQKIKKLRSIGNEGKNEIKKIVAGAIREDINKNLKAFRK